MPIIINEIEIIAEPLSPGAAPVPAGLPAAEASQSLRPVDIISVISTHRERLERLKAE
jgi:hypothetical protein